ncbi:Trypanosome variant surface glycoprotein C-terminal domain containing protein [Trypanosoma brucei equiperdum]|uniref:Trypanosome variant surface glycoprotein C-terminal domain containing protein n=1 Tax=Trypanosoma brucei equiperdum TaxID=630700 RepID=A0A3L6KX61_9TRYP|nr:Trypanosome variant surface glycoprotein C-terminal domain containing protein [Trypanosoma brucei equiperdum]
MRPAAPPQKASAAFTQNDPTLTSDSTTGKCTITLKQPPTRATECEDALEKAPKLKMAAAQLKAAQTIKAAPDNFFTYRTPTIIALAASDGNTASMAQNTAKDCATGAQPRKIVVNGIGADIKFDDDKEYTATSLFGDGDAATSCGDPSKLQDKKDWFLDKLKAALCNAKDKHPVRAAAVATSSTKELAEDPDMLKIAAQLLTYPPGILDPEKQEDKQKLQKSVAEIFRSETKPLTENFLKTLTQPKVTYKVAGKVETKTIEEIANSPEAGLAFSFFSSKRYQKPAEATTKTAPEADVKSDAADKTGESKDGGNTAKPVCSSFQNQTECEAVKGPAPPGKKSVCGWIEGKCQDSSILVSKQFALSMVSAAFISFVGF